MDSLFHIDLVSGIDIRRIEPSGSL